VTGTTRIALDYQSIKRIPVPLIDKQEQLRLVAFMNAAAQSRREKLQKADALLMGMDSFVSDLLGISDNKEHEKLCFAVKFKDLDCVIDVKRYQNLYMKEQTAKISDYCDIIDSKINVNDLGNTIVDWIRIDDLPNKPWEIDNVRSLHANEMNGTFFEVEIGDVLVARLGPTILNQKIVVVTETKRKTLASAEFLVLRGKNKCLPDALMWVMKTEQFKNLMYSHTRGSTPSRYRLNREDMLKLKLPALSNKFQNIIVNEAAQRKTRALALKHEAETEWAAAKAQFEQELLGGTGK
jgi:restriction endonuclease S subunit